MFGKKSLLLLSLASAAVLSLPALGMADTITVHSLAANSPAGTFTYDVEFDSAADVLSNDGFVIYDFNDLTSWSIAGGLGSSQFSLTQTLTSNTLNQASTVDINGAVAAGTNGVSFDNPSVMNLSFAYVGPPVPFDGAASAVLTLTTASLGSPVVSVSSTVDHSGPTPQTPFSYADNAVLVPGEGAPNFTPLPMSSIGGGVLFGLIGLGQFMKSRRVNA